MPGEKSLTLEPRLTIRSQLDEVARLWPWVDALAAEYTIPENTQFAINLCLEEALSNIIRHGYRSGAKEPITISFASTENSDLEFTIEDHAPPFDPLGYSDDGEAYPPPSIDQLQPGGQGIRLLRKFAGDLAYQRLPDGNRLTIRFTIPQ
jgi:anti-sigma regulatory factor (Ser/Thr protein kinase)